MTNLEYIFEFANKHNFPQSNCEIMFNSIGGNTDVFAADDEIISVKFDKSLVENEIKIADIRFDIDSLLDEDIFFAWQKDNPNISLKNWIKMGSYVPTDIKNIELLDEIDMLTRDIQMKLESIFGGLDDGDSDYDDDDDDDDDSDYDEEDDIENGENY